MADQRAEPTDPNEETTPCEECALPVDHDDEDAVSVKDGAAWESSRIWWHGPCFKNIGSPKGGTVTSVVLENCMTLTLPKVGTLLVISHRRDRARLATDMEHGGTSKTYDKHVTIHRVQYSIDLGMQDTTTVPELEMHKFDRTIPGAWSYQRSSQPLRYHDWRRSFNDYPSAAARKFFREYIVEPFAEWLNSPDSVGILAGGAQQERDQLRRSALGTIEEISSKSAELRLLLNRLERGEQLTDDEKSVLSSTRLERR